MFTRTVLSRFARPAAALAGLVACCAIGGLRVAAGEPAPAPVATGFMVSFHESAPLQARLDALRRAGLENDATFASSRFARLKPRFGRGIGKMSAVNSIVAQLRREPAVRVAEPDWQVNVDWTPNDPSLNALWGLNNTGQTGGTADADVDAVEAWDVTKGSPSVVVAVIDTGVDYNHPDLAANILRDAGGAVVGYDFVNNDADPLDDHYHGTHVAGTIAAVANNGIGVVGVAPSVKIMPMKFLSSSGSGSTSGAIKCIDWAVQRGAKILSNSWGGGGASTLLAEAIQRAEAAGVLFVAAAGNNGGNNDTAPFWPANYSTQFSNVMAVAATDGNDNRAGFSNYGATTVDIAAPGVGILSTTPGGNYSYLNGTSMACPHVSGAAALVASRYPSFTPAQVRARLKGRADQVTSLNGQVASGRLNAYAAVNDGPSAPSNLTGIAGSARVDLTWQASAGATTYSVKRSTTSGGGYAVVASGLTGTSYADTSVTNGTTYYYIATAVNASGESAGSNEVTVTPLAPGTAIRINCGGASYTGSGGQAWSADRYFTTGSTYGDGGRGISGTPDPAVYRFLRYGSLSYVIPAASGAYTLKLHFAEIYFTAPGKRVFNVKVGGVPILSNFDVVASAGTNAAIVKSFSITASSGSVTIEFVSVVENPIINGIELLPGNSGPTPPAAPTNLTATASSSRVDLGWDASSGAQSYSVKRSTTAGSGYATVASGLTTNSYSDTTVTNGTRYYYVVTASNQAGESGNSNEASGLPTAPPSNALRVNCGGPGYTNSALGTTWLADQYFAGGATYAVTGRGISGTADPTIYQSCRYGAFTYALPAADGQYDLVLHFAEIYYTSTGKRVFNVRVNGSAVLSNFDVVAAAGGPNAAVTRTFRVTPVNGAVTVATSIVTDYPLFSGIELIPVSGGSPQPPAAPGGVAAVAGDKKVDLSWSTSNGATSYTVKRSTTSGGGYSTVASGLTGVSYSDTGLTNGTTYYYVVTASNSVGESGNSSEVSATPSLSVFRLNAGGAAYTGSGGVQWSADQYFSGGSTYGVSGRNIGGTADPRLYQSLRYGQHTYQLPAANGNYTLKLHFAEIWFSTPGNRIFNVQVNGANVLTNFDVVAAAGGANTAVVRTFNVTASGGYVTVGLRNVLDNAMVSAIELVPAP